MCFLHQSLWISEQLLWRALLLPRKPSALHGFRTNAFSTTKKEDATDNVPDNENTNASNASVLPAPTIPPVPQGGASTLQSVR